GRDWRNRSAAPVEDDDVRVEGGSELRPLQDVRGEGSARHPAAGTAAADGRHAREQGRIEMVGGGVASCTRERDEIVQRRRRRDELRLGGPSPSHRDNDDAAVAGEQPRDVTRDRGLADALARPDYGERRPVERVEPWRVEAEVGP